MAQRRHPLFVFFFQAEDGIRDPLVTGVQTCALPICVAGAPPSPTLLGRLKELGFRPVHVYGLTETYGPHTVCAWHEEWDALALDEQSQIGRASCRERV